MTAKNNLTAYLCALVLGLGVRVSLVPSWDVALCMIGALALLGVHSIFGPSDMASKEIESLREEVKAAKESVSKLAIKIGFK